MESEKTAKMTYKQGGFLWGMTGRRFREHATPPTLDGTSKLIELCKSVVFDKCVTVIPDAVETVRRWYPDFTADELHWHRRSTRRNGKPHTTAPSEHQNGRHEAPHEAPSEDAAPKSEDAPRSEAPPKTDPKPHLHDDEEAPKPKRTRKPKARSRPTDLNVEISAFVKAGVRNLFVVGPAGCGKTTLAQVAADDLDLSVCLISCSQGTPAYTFVGRRHPIHGTYEETEFTKAYGVGWVVILDEIDKLDPSTAACVNAALANGHIPTPNGPIPRHADTVVIATANTWGNGADRQYVGSNQLDGATLDRFAGGRLVADYDPDYEAQFDADVVAYCRAAREHVKTRRLRRIVSTRMIQACTLLKAAGLDWQGQVTADWSDEEKRGL